MGCKYPSLVALALFLLTPALGNPQPQVSGQTPQSVSRRTVATVSNSQLGTFTAFGLGPYSGIRWMPCRADKEGRCIT
jgi:hypothetical protein